MKNKNGGVEVSKLLKKYFGVSKPVIVMVHFPPLPGSPLYDGKSSEDPVEWVRHDLLVLQEEGVDAVMFGNEADRPYKIQADVASPTSMAYAIGRLRSEIKVPFGVDVLWDPHSTLALAKATGAAFVREIFTGVYSGDMGIWNTSPGEVFRYKRLLEVDDLLLLYNINAEFAAPLAMRPIEVVAKSVVVSSLAQAICVSGPITGEETNLEDLKKVKEAVGEEIAILANTGVNAKNVEKTLKVADGIVVGTSLKKEGITWNQIDRERTKRFMEVVNKARN